MKKFRHNLIAADAVIVIKRWKIVRARYAMIKQWGFDVYHNCGTNPTWHFASRRKCTKCGTRLPRMVKETRDDLRRLHK